MTSKKEYALCVTERREISREFSKLNAKKNTNLNARSCNKLVNHLKIKTHNLDKLERERF